jgi:hypothetical protein
MATISIIGKKVIGFKFKGGPGWNSEMDQHIGKIGTIHKQSHSWCVGYPGGNFAQAVVNNDLSEAFGRADEINVHCMRFYVMLMYNVGAPTILFQ